MVMEEHVAGTEFVIGPMFLAYGASASDVFIGLLIGNLLVVLSWTFVVASMITVSATSVGVPYYGAWLLAGPNYRS